MLVKECLVEGMLSLWVVREGAELCGDGLGVAFCGCG